MFRKAEHFQILSFFVCFGWNVNAMTAAAVALGYMAAAAAATTGASLGYMAAAA